MSTESFLCAGDPVGTSHALPLPSHLIFTAGSDREHCHAHFIAEETEAQANALTQRASGSARFKLIPSACTASSQDLLWVTK